MSLLQKAYKTGMAEMLVSGGLRKDAAERISSIASGFNKKASLFNFTDTDDYGNRRTNWSSIIIPALAALAAGYGMYNVGMEGKKDRNIFENTKNYIGRLGDKYIRKSRPRPIYDYKRYFEDR